MMVAALSAKQRRVSSALVQPLILKTYALRYVGTGLTSGSTSAMMEINKTQMVVALVASLSRGMYASAGPPLRLILAMTNVLMDS